MTAIGRDIAGLNLLSEASEVVLKLTPLFAGSAITHWYKSASLLENEHHWLFRNHILPPASVGSVKRKVLPGPSLATAQSRPPCASMIERLMVKPMPMPCTFVV